MKLSELVIKWKTKGMMKTDALIKAKVLVKKAGKRWTANVQEVFNSSWRKRVKVEPTPVPVQKKKSVVEKKIVKLESKPVAKRTEVKKVTKGSQSGSKEERVLFFHKELGPKFESGPDVVRFAKEGIEKKPKEMSEFLKKIKELGFKPIGHTMKYEERTVNREVRHFQDAFKNGAVHLIDEANNTSNNKFICYVVVSYDKSKEWDAVGSRKPMKIKIKR